MDKKKASLITMIMLGIYLVMSFMPIVYVEKYFEAIYDSPGAYRESSSWYCNAYIANIRFLAIICLAFSVVGIVGMFFHYTNKEHKYLKYGTYAPIGAFAAFAIMSVYELNHINPIGEPVGYYTKGSTGYFRFDAGWGFYILTALLIVAAALAYMIATGKNIEQKGVASVPKSSATSTKPSQPEKTEVASSPTKESLEELIKYKDLLDNEIITAEEFEAKKQEILGIKASKPEYETAPEQIEGVSDVKDNIVEIAIETDKHSDAVSAE